MRTQADGSVRVEFNTVGAAQVDPSLIERISQAYDRLMGRWRRQRRRPPHPSPIWHFLPWD